VAERFFSGVPHPYLLGVCCPNLLVFQPAAAAPLKAGFPFLVPHLIYHQFLQLQYRLRRPHRSAGIIHQRHRLYDWDTAQSHNIFSSTISHNHQSTVPKAFPLGMGHERNPMECLNLLELKQPFLLE
jgi:hypothetical protein